MKLEETLGNQDGGGGGFCQPFPRATTTPLKSLAQAKGDPLYQEI